MHKFSGELVYSVKLYIFVAGLLSTMHNEAKREKPSDRKATKQLTKKTAIQ